MSRNIKFTVPLAALLILSAYGSFFCKADDEPSGLIRPLDSDFPGRVNVVFKKGVSPESARSIVQAHSMTVLREHQALYEYSGRVFFYLVSDALTSEEMVRLLEKDPHVHTVKEESTRSIPPDPHLHGIK